MMEKNILITLENVGFRYESGDEIIKDISLSIDEGDFYFLIGISGVGKTTLLKIIYTALHPSRGLMRIFGQEMVTMPLNQYPLIRRKIGGLFDDLPLINEMNVEDNIALPLVVGEFSKNQQKMRVQEILEWVQLDKFSQYYPPMLSSGQRQRVSIARAVVSNPILFLADEPTANVDDKMAERLLYLIRKLHSIGTTIILATHNTHLLSKIKQAKILHMKNGFITKYNSYQDYKQDKNMSDL